MKAAAKIGLVLLAASAVPNIQMARELLFWERGQARYEEQSLLELPVQFAGHTLTVEDTLPWTGTYSEDAVAGTVSILLDGKEILPPSRAMIRPGRRDLGRYHLWLDVWTFRDRRTAEHVLYLGRRLDSAAEMSPRYELVRVAEDGSYTIRELSLADRAESYPIFRTIQFLEDEAHAVYRWSLMNVWPNLLVPVMYPWLTLVFGTILLIVGRRRSRNQNDGGLAPAA